jgi:hypothetical protein
VVAFQGQLGTFSPVTPLNSEITGSGTFTLTVDQTVYPNYPPSLTGSSPSGGTFASASFSGTLSAGSAATDTTGELIVTFVSPPSLTIGGITYSLLDLGCGSVSDCGLLPNQLAIGNESVALEAEITAPPGTITTGSTAPEPAFYGLTGMGLAGFAALVMRRKRNAA